LPQRIQGGNELSFVMVKKMREDLKYAELSYDLIGCAMRVHSELGPGQNERFYHLALAESLKQTGIACDYKPSGVLVHRGRRADEFEADLIVADTLIAELKVLDSGFAAEHFTQLICYLKFWKKDLGILIDFEKESLVHKRVPYTDKRGSLDERPPNESLAALATEDRKLANVIVAPIVRLSEQYGLGYRDTTLYDGVHAAQRATVQAYARHLSVPFGLAVNFGRRSLEIRAVLSQSSNSLPP
jgi:GxxExxY protein